VTEFYPHVPWASKDNTIPCAAGHHIHEGRWLRDPAVMRDYLRFWFFGGGSPDAYTFWVATSAWANYEITGNATLVKELYPAVAKNYLDGMLKPNWNANYSCYWHLSDREGEENSVGGDGCRPVSNSVMFGEALALGKMAAIAQPTNASAQSLWAAQAQLFRKVVLEKLWSEKLNFFVTLTVAKPNAPPVPPPSPMPAGWTRVAADDGDFCCDQRKCVDGHSAFLYEGKTGQAACVAKCAADKRCNFVTMDSVTNYCFNAQYCNMTSPFGGHKGNKAVRTYSKRKLRAPPPVPPGPGAQCPAKGEPHWPVGQQVTVREIMGLSSPWYFRVPANDSSFAKFLPAWKQLSDPQGFKAAWGPRTAELRAPCYNFTQFRSWGTRHECNWNGPSWPFENSKLLFGMANLLLDYPPQQIVTRADFMSLLRSYVKMHVQGKAANGVSPWIGEVMHPETGEWLARQIMYSKSKPADKMRDRGIWYNHSVFIDLILSGLFGFRALGALAFSVNPLSDGSLAFFALDNLRYQGRNLAILWDSTGAQYNKGKGLRVLLDGKVVASSPTMGKLVVSLKPRRLKTNDAAAGSAAAALPHIVMLLVDDFGWAEVPWHRPKGYSEVIAPNMQALVDEGIELDRNYAFKFCSPTRSAIQSGRNPIHVNAQNVGMQRFDPTHPLTGIAGIPVKMTGMATRLAEAGYKHRVFSGKWDAGMAHKEQSARGRGYPDALYYFAHANDYWSFNTAESCPNEKGSPFTRDLWGSAAGTPEKDGPQTQLLNPPHCLVQNMTQDEKPVKPFPANMEGCVYEEDLFTNHSLSHIAKHDTVADGPMLLFHSSHSIHSPLEVPPGPFGKFEGLIDYRDRRVYHAMVYNVDLAIGRIVGALKTKKMYLQGRGAGNNFPLKGGKAGNWEGGIRVNGFVSGGFLPKQRRGVKLDGLITAWDWYATFVHGVAKLDAADKQAAAANLPPIDSVDQWAYLSGATDTPPRSTLPIGTTADAKDLWASQNDIVVHGMIVADYEKKTLFKLLVGALPQSIWTGPQFPNATTAKLPGSETVFFDCRGVNGTAGGCLFDLLADPTEHVDVAAKPEHAALVQQLKQRMAAEDKTVFKPLRPPNPAACEAALGQYYDASKEVGFWGPFIKSDDSARTGK